MVKGGWMCWIGMGTDLGKNAIICSNSKEEEIDIECKIEVHPTLSSYDGFIPYFQQITYGLKIFEIKKCKGMPFSYLYIILSKAWGGNERGIR